MIIRRAQLERFENASGPAFETEMVSHLKTYTPVHSEILGEAGLRGIIRLGVVRARRYGWTKRNTVQFYIELMFLLGVDFDTDGQYPWCGNILRSPEPRDETERADLLYDEVTAYVNVVGGPNREYANNALRRTRSMPFEGMPVTSPHFKEHVISRMRQTYPEKCDYLGEKPLETVIPRALKEARKYSVTSDAGISLFAGLMFALGHGVINDPKYSFIESTLKNTGIAEANKRAERVYSKVMTYLDHVIARMDGR